MGREPIGQFMESHSDDVVQVQDNVHVPYYLDIRPTSTISPPPLLGSKSCIDRPM